MKETFLRIHKFLLPQSDDLFVTPYVWLVYLGIYFISFFSEQPEPLRILYSSVALLLFLALYFNGHWASSKQIWKNIVGILIVGSILATYTVGASVFFVYAGAFCCILGSPKKGIVGLLLITLWIILFSWYFDRSIYFYGFAIVFSWLIGGLNIYQHQMYRNRRELILSRQETRDLAKIAERERIARDLHDSIGHTFSVLTLKAELVGKLIDVDPQRAKQEVSELENISRAALTQIREVVSGFRASDLKAELAHAKYVLESNEIQFDYSFEQFPISDNINKELAIILKELVTNVLKHSEADQVQASIEKNNSEVRLYFSDNGKGMRDNLKQGFGLTGIVERLDKLAGQFSITNEQGTQVIITVPIKEQS